MTKKDIAQAVAARTDVSAAAAGARGAVAGLEGAEAGEADVLTLGELLPDDVEGGADDVLGRGVGGRLSLIHI